MKSRRLGFTVVDLPAARQREASAFTLVELLVVIGIIAVLVGILLPALANARKQANAVKCETSLREIGNAFFMYSIDNRGYFPPAKAFGPPNSLGYVMGWDDVAADKSSAKFWTDFLAKYVTKTKMGGASGNASEAADARKTVFWGCPAFEGYTGSPEPGGIYRVQTGYGMNAFPEYTADYPKPANPPNLLGDADIGTTVDKNAIAVVGTGLQAPISWGKIGQGRWYKQKNWTSASRRALVADTIFWLLEVQAAPLNGTIPGQRIANNNPNTTTWYAPVANGQTLYDFYRHGKYPNIEGSDSSMNGHYASSGGKVAFNVLFADGHVSTLNSRQDGYMAARMRYPG